MEHEVQVRCISSPTHLVEYFAVISLKLGLRPETAWIVLARVIHLKI